MLIPPKYFLTPKISKLLSSIEASREVVESINIPVEVELNIRRKSTLSSSLFSARIEGNPLLPNDLITTPSGDLKKIEVNNILRAINWISDRSDQVITLKDILTLHEYSMKSIDYIENLGKLRKSHEGIFSSTGAVIYHAPPPSLIPKLLERLIKYINSNEEQFAPIRAINAHYIFEKIHPFIDGSGRVGRLLLLVVLSRSGYSFKGILPFEEKIDKRREMYYKMLEEPESDLTNYIEFMLEILAESAEQTKKEVLEKRNLQKHDFLLPRRNEILSIIRDHKLVNMDIIKRRFSKINERTLRNDIKKLIDGGFVQKLGTTRGVYYKQKEQ
jgi:Fic family protein